jgi:hypothetical protein
MIPSTFDRSVYERLCAAGMPSGLGTRESACVMAALNLACGGDLTDSASSPCVLPAAAAFAILLNDARWSSPTARAAGMHGLGLALLGTADIDRATFVRRLAEGTIRRVLPIALRAAGLTEHADRCEREGTREAADAASADADTAATAAAYAAASAYAATAYAATAAHAAHDAASAASTATAATAYAYADTAATAAAYAAYAAAATTAATAAHTAAAYAAYAAAGDASAAYAAYAATAAHAAAGDASAASTAAADIPLLAAARLATEILTEMRGAL